MQCEVDLVPNETRNSAFMVNVNLSCVEARRYAYDLKSCLVSCVLSVNFH